MSIIGELFKQGPTLLGKAAAEEDVVLAFDRFSKNEHIKLQTHYDLWRQRIRNAAINGNLLSNGWAFSMLSGVAAFEAHVRADPDIRPIYSNKSGEIERMVDELKAIMGQKKFNGVMVYGYGNILREAHFIEQATKLNLLKKGRIYLLDCSLFYHIIAQSQLNPLRSFIRDQRRISPILLDYCESDKCRKRLSYLRDDLNSFFPVLHLFLGNTFCNLEAPALQTILESTVRPGDIVVAEYANYSSEEISDLKSDYVNTMAIRAAAELFATFEDNVKASTIKVGENAKAIQIEVPDCDHDGNVIFRSMLRRRFLPQEILDQPYEKVWDCNVLSGALSMDSYHRMPRPV